MLGRFLHWYPGYTAESALAMPAVRFFALSRAIRKLEAAADMRQLRVSAAVAFPGQSGERVSDLGDDLQTALGVRAAKPASTIIPGLTPGVQPADGDELLAEHRRLAEEYERLRKG